MFSLKIKTKCIFAITTQEEILKNQRLKINLLFYQVESMTKRQINYFKTSSILSLSLFFTSCATKSIPITYDGHIYLKTTINDSINGNFMYDTGVAEFCLDKTFVTKNKFQFDKKQNIEIVGVGNDTEITEIVNDKIYYKVDKKYNHSRQTFLIGLKDFMGQNIDGILGIKTFQNRPHKIDFINKKLTFTDKHENYDSIKFIYEGDKIYVPLHYTIDSQQYSGKFILDLGSSITVLNSTSGINTVNAANSIGIGGIGGETKGKTLIFDAIQLGNQLITDYVLDISENTVGALADVNYDGLLGTDILDDFDIIVDLEQKTLYLKPNKKFNHHKKMLYKSFSYIDNAKIDGSWMVSYIYLDTDAYEKGLRLYDEILEIDGVKVSKLKRVSFYRSLKLNQELKLKLRRNEETLIINVILNKFLGKN